MSTDVDIDMNVELMAHGYSNGLVGVFGGGCVCVCSFCSFRRLGCLLKKV